MRFFKAKLVGRIGNGYLVDRFFGPRAVAIVFVGAAIAVAILWSGLAVHFWAADALLLGLAAGAEGDLIPFVVSQYFGMRLTAEIYGCIFGVFTLRTTYAAAHKINGENYSCKILPRTLTIGPGGRRIRFLDAQGRLTSVPAAICWPPEVIAE